MALVAPVLLIMLGNISVFVMVLIQIRKITANKSSSNNRSAVQDLRAVASISVLLGLTWSMGFFSFGPGKVFLMYLFTICNSFQGKCVTWQLILKLFFFFRNKCVRFVYSLCQVSLCFSSTAWWKRTWGSSGGFTCAADVSDSTIAQVTTSKQNDAGGHFATHQSALVASLRIILLSPFSPPSASRMERPCDAGGQPRKEQSC